MSKFSNYFSASKEDRKKGQIELMQRERVLKIEMQLMANENESAVLTGKIEKAITGKNFDLETIVSLQADLESINKSTKALKEIKTVWFTDAE